MEEDDEPYLYVINEFRPKVIVCHGKFNAIFTKFPQYSALIARRCVFICTLADDRSTAMFVIRALF